jgi:hypothetical protein
LLDEVAGERRLPLPNSMTILECCVFSVVKHAATVVDHAAMASVPQRVAAVVREGLGGL